MNDKTRSILSVVFLALILLGFNHCVVQGPKKTSKQSNVNNTSTNTSTIPNDNFHNPTPPSPVEQPSEEVIQEQQVQVGIMNFEQINATYSALTGVSKMDNNIRNTYNSIETQLPTENDIKSFLSANQVGITKLASEYCHRLIDNSTLRASIWPQVNFGRSPAQELNDAKINTIITNMLDRFYGQNIDMGIRQNQFNIIKTLFYQLLQGENQDSSTTTRNVIKGVCIATLSSANVVVL